MEEGKTERLASNYAKVIQKKGDNFKVLFLDDDPMRYEVLTHNHPDWNIVWVQRVSTFLHMAQRSHYDLIMMDHDLGYMEILDAFPRILKEYNGCDAVGFLIKNPGNSVGTPIVIHSWNPDGADRMYKSLKEAGYQVSLKEF